MATCRSNRSRSKDRYAELRPFRKRPVADLADALQQVRALWPDAVQEGSTGLDYTFTVKVDDGSRLVGHAWSRWTKPERWWLRVESR